MALSYLGQTLDIHGGGQDLIFPHHENEIAQSESLTGVPFVRYWLHNGLMQLGQDKMSKSIGNLITVKEALSRYSTDAIRLFVLSSHYRSPMTYSEETLEAMERGAERLRRAVHEMATAIERLPSAAYGGVRDTFDEKGKLYQYYRQEFTAAMDDDFNTPQAIAVLFQLATEINRDRELGLPSFEMQIAIIELAGVLGLTLKEKAREELARAIPSTELIELLVSVRDKLRAEQNWALADNIRSRLRELGVVLEDTPKGTVWHYRNY